jgi:hypothetical protein
MPTSYNDTQCTPKASSLSKWDARVSFGVKRPKEVSGSPGTVCMPGKHKIPQHRHLTTNRHCSGNTATPTAGWYNDLQWPNHPKVAPLQQQNDNEMTGTGEEPPRTDKWDQKDEEDHSDNDNASEDGTDNGENRCFHNHEEGDNNHDIAQPVGGRVCRPLFV